MTFGSSFRRLIPVIALLAPAVAVGILAAAHFRGSSGVATAVVSGVATFIVGQVIARGASRLQQEPTTRYLLGLGIAAGAVLLRLSPLLFGEVNAVSIAGRTVVVGEIAAVLAIIGIGLMLGTMRDVDAQLRRQPLHRRPFLRALAVALAIAPLVPFALASLGDLGPLVVLTIAVTAMVSRVVEGVWFMALAGLILTWLAVMVISTVAIARDRLDDALLGGFQLDLARMAVAYGGLVWGGGLGTNPYAENIPVASTDHLAAYLAGSVGVLPFLLVVALLFAGLTRLAKTLPPGPTTRAIVSSGLLLAAGAQTSWALLGSLGALPLTGLPLPLLSVSGSSWAAWGLAGGFVAGSLASRREVDSAPSSRASSLLTGFLSMTGIAVPVVALVVAVSLIAAPDSAGVGGAVSSVAPRGDIVTRDGRVLATSTPSGERTYPTGSAAVEAVGLIAPLVNVYGLERAVSSLTTCGGGGLVAVLSAGTVGPRCHPSTVVSTLDSQLQSTAVDVASGGAGGAVLVLRVSTLEVLAAYSRQPGSERPDPTLVATGELPIDDVSPLLDTSPFFPAIFSEQISPGSVFKVPVLAVAAQAGVTVAPDAGHDFGVENYWGGPCPGDDAVSALGYSCNTVTASVAAALGQDALAEGLDTYFGLDSTDRTVDTLDLPSGRTGLVDGDLDEFAFARSAIGLESVRVSMFELALMIAHAIGAPADASPTLVVGRCDEGAASPQLVVLESSPAGSALDDSTIAMVRDGMSLSLSDGTATSFVDGLSSDVGDLELLAKSGTPDRETPEGVHVNDSVFVVVAGDYLVLTRIQGTPENPTPNEDSPAMTPAQTMLDAVLQRQTVMEHAPLCPAWGA